jgi:DNA-binding MarR family transcriptional regulator
MSDEFTFTAGKANGSPDSLGSQVCFAVYCAMLGFNKVYRQALRVLDITYPQYLVLMVLRERDHVAMTDLAQRLTLESSTLTPMLKRLEEQGLVRRKRYAFDERKVVISLTEKGIAVITRARSVPAQVSRASGLTAEESRALRTLLAKLNLELGKNRERS